MPVRCRFLLSRLLFLSVLCIIIYIMAIVRLNASFSRCFYGSVCRWSVIFVYTVLVFHVPLLLCCLSLVHFVTFSILLHLASMDLYSYSVWMRFLQVLVFVCKLVAMYFLSRCCVFFRLSLLFLFIFVFFNILQVATVRESCVLPFTCFFVLRAPFQGSQHLLHHWFCLCWVYSC